MLIPLSDSDRKFITNLYTEYYDIMKQQSLYIVKNNIIAEDVIHNACIKFIEHIDTIRKLENYFLAAYIITTVKRISYNHFESRYSKDKRETPDIDDDFINNVKDNSTNFEETIINKITVEEIRAALIKLPQKYHEVLKLRYLLDMSDEEISNTLGISASSVRVYIKTC